MIRVKQTVGDDQTSEDISVLAKLGAIKRVHMGPRNYGFFPAHFLPIFGLAIIIINNK